MASCFRRNQQQLNKEYLRLLAQQQDAKAKPTTETPECPDLMIHCDYQLQTGENYHRYGLRSGSVYAFGQDETNQLGQPQHTDLEEGQKPHTFGPLLVSIQSLDKKNPVKIWQVSAGGQHSCALSTNGVPYSW